MQNKLEIRLPKPIEIGLVRRIEVDGAFLYEAV